MDYQTLRTFADSWGLLALFAIFLFVIVYVFRRGSGKRYRDAAAIPLRDDKPAAPDEDDDPETRR